MELCFERFRSIKRMLFGLKFEVENSLSKHSRKRGQNMFEHCFESWSNTKSKLKSDGFIDDYKVKSEHSRTQSRNPKCGRNISEQKV